MVEIIQISDLHYGSEFVPEYLNNIIRYVEENPPDIVICTGDCVHKGRIEQLEEIQEYFKIFRKITNFMAVPGNHDAKNSGLIFFEKIIGPRRSRIVLEEKDTIIVGICTARDDVSYGECGDEQLEWMARCFNKVLENRVMALHHHLIPVPMSGQKFTTVRDAGELLEFTQLFEIDLVLMGHRHVPHAYVIGPTTFLYCGTSSSTKARSNDKPSFNHISLNEGDLEVHIIDSISLNSKLLLKREANHTKFVRPRRTRIEHLLNSEIWNN